MLEFERDYALLVAKVLQTGERRNTRNQKTRSLFAQRLIVDLSGGYEFPLLQGRKMYYKGVFGELAAILRGPKSVEDFRKWGCNYWDKWGDKNGLLYVDYGNAWFEGMQMEHLKTSLAHNPTDRRMLITGWRPDKIADLSLPCCHYAYQFYVTADKRIHMLWNQRSVDVMVGLPSDIVFAAAWLIMIANEFGFTPGIITMDFGDTHIYEGHVENAYKYLSEVTKLNERAFSSELGVPKYTVDAPAGKNFLEFEPSDITITGYKSLPAISFELYE